ncbi:hypothetical protein [Anaeromyxobacter oryzae]|uniref:Uncharacterized protein n=1 Tax=Anaeromyxobacter oryzae TaxID=2918170 RepID=A0ABM7WW60_9BACT|nr:hypothetical protein [Anaeromyxobacter oryzae]BDG03743.1 hypothetical protein AMOR_27390 [Anaeromyxobacter oryzae]
MRLAAPRLLAAATLAAILSAPAARAASTPDEQARFLAGLPVPAGSPLAKLEEGASWKAHQKAMDDAWAKLSKRLAVMDGWAKAELAPRIQPNAKLLYLFGGPDAVTPLCLYPDAPAYLLAGLEKVGRVPPPEELKPKALENALSGLAEALRTVVPASFFRTDEMGHDLRGDEIDGVQPILYLFIARSGGKILGAEHIEIDATGAAKPKADGEKWGAGTPGVRVRFQREGHAPQEMIYVRVDLGDAALQKKPGFLTFARAYGNANAFLKAASFILHDNRFSKPRALLVEQSLSVLQDDSGLPFKVFEKGGWELTTFGTYLQPKPPFQRAYQKPLIKLFAAEPARPLPFKIGYRKDADESNLLLAVKKPATAAATAAPK